MSSSGKATPAGMPAPDVLIPLEQHLARILAALRPLPATEVDLLDAVGLVLADEVVASTPLPAFDNSGMDGYAVRTDDVRAATHDDPVALPVVGDIAAGAASLSRIEPGTAARIMTGAPIPQGCDAVVPVEWSDLGVEEVRIFQAPSVGQHIRHQGEDVRAGDLMVAAGSLIGPREVAAIGSVGLPRLRVHARPRVLVISTGAELREPGEPLGHDSIYDSNSFMLTAQARAAGAIATRVGKVNDSAEAFAAVLAEALKSADVIITSGGVSKGAFDVVKEVLGDRLQFDTVAMQPGKPQGFGMLDGVPIFTLPGNPVSSYISFEVFVLPALRALMGRSPYSRPTRSALLTHDIASASGKTRFLRGRLCLAGDEPTVTPSGGPGSHLVAGLAGANALIVVPPEANALPAGESVSVLALDERF